MTGIYDVVATKMTDQDYRSLVADMIIQIHKVTMYVYELEEEIRQLRARNDELTESKEVS